MRGSSSVVARGRPADGRPRCRREWSTSTAISRATSTSGTQAADVRTSAPTRLPSSTSVAAHALPDTISVGPAIRYGTPAAPATRGSTGRAAAAQWPQARSSAVAGRCRSASHALACSARALASRRNRTGTRPIGGPQRPRHHPRLAPTTVATALVATAGTSACGALSDHSPSATSSVMPGRAMPTSVPLSTTSSAPATASTTGTGQAAAAWRRPVSTARRGRRSRWPRCRAGGCGTIGLDPGSTRVHPYAGGGPRPTAPGRNDREHLAA